MERFSNLAIKDRAVSEIEMDNQMKCRLHQEIAGLSNADASTLSTLSNQALDWACVGVLCRKEICASKRGGSPYARWDLSNLRGDTVSLYSFGA